MEKINFLFVQGILFEFTDAKRFKILSRVHSIRAPHTHLASLDAKANRKKFIEFCLLKSNKIHLPEEDERRRLTEPVAMNEQIQFLWFLT